MIISFEPGEWSNENKNNLREHFFAPNRISTCKIFLHDVRLLLHTNSTLPMGFELWNIDQKCRCCRCVPLNSDWLEELDDQCKAAFGSYLALMRWSPALALAWIGVLVAKTGVEITREVMIGLLFPSLSISLSLSPPPARVSEWVRVRALVLRVFVCLCS